MHHPRLCNQKAGIRLFSSTVYASQYVKSQYAPDKNIRRTHRYSLWPNVISVKFHRNIIEWEIIAKQHE